MFHEEVESRARAGEVAARRREGDEAKGVAGRVTRREKVGRERAR